MSKIRELNKVYQKDEDIKRRWFTDDDFWDLIVWAENNKIIGFQLCYANKAFTWKKSGEYSHQNVDEHRNRTPILIPDGYFDRELIRDKFLEDSKDIDKQIVDLVVEKIMNYHNQ
ncbi:MAG: hypothetical protein MJB14_21160 [Spirochaetes bacterium]|nr:hypothetical protein [Spirochaetota bacterium]